MNLCGYCGRENDEDAMCCRECGTSFETLLLEQHDSAAEPDAWLFNSHLGVAFSSVLGVILIATGAESAILRAFYDVEVLANGGPFGKPGIYAVGIVAIVFVLPPILIGAFVFTFAVCMKRCQVKWHGCLAAIIALACLTSLVLLRDLRSFLPTVLLGTLTGSSVGWYIGSIFQITVGAWLQGWIAWPREGTRHGSLRDQSNPRGP